MSSPPAGLRLVTIPISHYCEKARWALDRAGLAYSEERHVQAIHRFYVRRAGGGLTAPVLVTADGALGDSEQILLWVDERLAEEERLFPADPPARAGVLELSRRFDALLGPAGRRLIYVHMFAAKGLVLRFNNAGVPPWEHRALRFGWAPLTGLVKRVLDVRPGVEVQDEATVWREFDFAAGLLADGRPYLCGDRFSAADLTFAALCAPVLVPVQYGTPLPQPDQLAPATADLVERARSHPAGKHALHIYATHRALPEATAAPAPSRS